MRVFPACLALLSSPALAEAPQVVTDIAPIHSLVAQVMEGVGAPDVILPPGASPHAYAMRPSEARALSQADLVVWVGPMLSPWLEESIETLAPQAEHLSLMEMPGVQTLAFRSGEMFVDAHDHGSHDDHGAAHEAKDDHGHDDDHEHAETAHDDHVDHAHDDHEDHADTGHDDHDAHGHAHAGGVDPHIWLDPQNAIAILSGVADALSRQDPENAATYSANAATAAAGITALQERIATQLAPLSGRPFVVAHDAYHYFEARFGLEAAAAISLADDAAAQPGHLAEVRETVATVGARCALVEPGTQEGLVEAVFAGSETKLGLVDATAAQIGLGSELYGALLTQTADAIAACLGD
ncbi:zinc ABC transporter substrate-binding protein [Roseobacter sinensis]|uniref:High-affinity zinc uptake system protein ZnuA n=1 Tax=Roseobacter sinensis TaxID=2931391 RepID=A0ABT3BL69_9RHOB|nr:zinc ABC transporter substrate-binding protein [Roseobacter sp. WL0113]MCV3274324.1 zinc ABC transporter substrate-binding protein [Roseobacter sp. WL0113]